MQEKKLLNVVKGLSLWIFEGTEKFYLREEIIRSFYIRTRMGKEIIKYKIHIRTLGPYVLTIF